jgi:hypothetical protein
MQYISPFHFLELSATDQIDKKDILLARKKMLAELELNDGNSILVNGKEVSKNDIIRFFDDLQQSTDLSYHVAVYRDKVLLKFLEYSIIENKDRFAANPLYTDAAFIDWVTPFYAASFAPFMTTRYQEINEAEWTTLIGDNPVLMSGYQAEIACRSLEKIIRLDIDRVDFLESKPVWEFTKEEVKDVCDPKRAAMLELLPEDRFGQVRDELAFNIMKLSIKMFNGVDRKWGVKQVKQARGIAASDRMKEILHDKQLEMESISSRARRSGWKFNFGNPRLIFILLFVVIKAATCNMGRSSSNNYDYNNYTPKVVLSDSAARRLLDSLSSKPALPAPLSDTAAKQSTQNLLHKEY